MATRQSRSEDYFANLRTVLGCGGRWGSRLSERQGGGQASVVRPLLEANECLLISETPTIIHRRTKNTQQPA
jgi:hypothetical protein